MRYVLAAVFFVALPLALNWLNPKDDSDPPNGRSGLIIYTDHLTGCQYLARPFFSSLTPRIAADGTHAGCRK